MRVPVCVRAYVHVCVGVYVCVCVSVCVRVRLCACVFMHVCLYVRGCAFAQRGWNSMLSLLAPVTLHSRNATCHRTLNVQLHHGGYAKK